MSFPESIRSIRRHGTACAMLAFLLLCCLLAHSAAFRAITLLSDSAHAPWPPRLLRHLTGIQFFQANWWFALAYLLFFLGMVVYMEVRTTPRWAVWSTFGFMSLPVVGYLVTCLRFCTGFITVMGPINSP